MCLIVDKPKFKRKIAKKDIEVYKVLVCSNNGNIFTPYQGAEVDFSTDFCAEGPEVIEDYTSRYRISSGFIHSYMIYKDAKDYATFASKASVINFTHLVYSAIIPKGTEYIIGRNDQICSKKIKFIKLISSY